MELMQDLLLDNAGDLTFVNGDLQLIFDRDIAVQALRQLLRTRKGEYRLNRNEGFNIDAFLGFKLLNNELIINSLQDVGLQLAEFVKFLKIDYTFDNATRFLSITFDALFADGYRQIINEGIDFSV